MHFFHLPMWQVSTFVERPDLHNEILKGLANDPSPFSTIQRLCIVHGLGGAGKSQLVHYYAKKMSTRYSGIFWIDATSTDSIGCDFEHLHELMYPDQKGKGPECPKFDKLFRAIGDWFSRRSERFLLIFDGADNIDNPKDLSNVDLRKVVPQNGSVDIIVTTRRSSAQGFGKFSLEVGEMEEKEALELLQNSSGLDLQQLKSSEVEEMRNIIRELGFLALAIQLTGSYIAQTPRISTNILNYLREYRQRRKQLLENTPGLADQYTTSVLSSWEVSFESLSRVSIIAANLLSFLSFFESANISELWFEPFSMFMCMHESGDGTVNKEVRYCRSVISPKHPFTYYDLEQGFKTLTAFSFIRRMPTEPGYSIHKLVHAWGYDRLGHHKKLDLVRVIMLFFICKISICPALHVEQQRVAKHAMAAFNVISGIELQTFRDDVCKHLRVSFVPFFDRIEDWSNKYKIQLFLLDCVKDSRGKDHLDSLIDMETIAETLHRQAKHQEAVFLQKEVVEAFARLPPTHPYEYLEAMERLVFLLQQSGEFEEGERIWKTAVEEKARLDGEGRLNRSSSDKYLDLSALGLKDPMREGLPGVVEAMLGFIDSHEQNFGAEDRRTMMAGDHLACFLMSQGFLESAQTVLEGIVCCFGATTDGSRDLCLDKAARFLVSLGSLTIMKGLRGDLRNGEVVLRELLLFQRKFNGLEHSHTMTTFRNLILHLKLQGKRDEMVKMMKETVKDMTPGKPQTLIILD